MGVGLSDDDRKAAEDDLRAAARAKLDSVLRLEMVQFERWVLSGGVRANQRR